VYALVITGPPGAGKSSVLEALSDQLVVEDARHASVEVEALTAAHPALGDEQWTAPISAVCGLYRDFGYERLLVTVTVESQADLDAALRAIDADSHDVVRLEAEPETLRRRIVEREPRGWPGLDQLLQASERLGPVIAGLDGVGLALSTESQEPQTIAERIRANFAAALGRPA
jgi:ribose 1,5-bisphosphokinase PhnN